MPKYSQEIIFNDDEVYDFLFDPRGIPQVEQYATKTFSKNIKKIKIRAYNHVWKQGDKLYKLAAKQYGNFRFWWVIAIVNKISSEADLNYGDIIRIPINHVQIVENI